MLLLLVVGFFFFFFFLDDGAPLLFWGPWAAAHTSPHVNQAVGIHDIFFQRQLTLFTLFLNIIVETLNYLLFITNKYETRYIMYFISETASLKTVLFLFRFVKEIPLSLAERFTQNNSPCQTASKRLR